jgi:hypothetical protein
MYPGNIKGISMKCQPSEPLCPRLLFVIGSIENTRVDQSEKLDVQPQERGTAASYLQRDYPSPLDKNPRPYYGKVQVCLDISYRICFIYLERIEQWYSFSAFTTFILEAGTLRQPL